jgi:hypothetical protein
VAAADFLAGVIDDGPAKSYFTHDFCQVAGTYAHKDIVFEFASWVSVEFKLYRIKECQRLKEQELQQLGWDIRRNLTKINYRIHTDAIRANPIPPELTPKQINLI